ncbi:MAG TPA: CGNR zinc finger domain-containing protein [Solirubrobacteraceae bacterium]|nr:CGNR zinc finger domain-containing protein [Solirubrobacteraceae bacterium]
MRQSLEEPGDRAPAPGSLRLVQLFVNTNDLETGPDLLPDAAALHAWLVERGLLNAAEPVTDDDHARAIELREAIRELVSAHAGLPHDAFAAQMVNDAGLRAGLRPVLDDPATRFEPSSGGVDGALGRIVAAIHASIAEGTWERLKACERDVCRWAFYDHSKNRSGHWCSMAVCGQREKNRRAYRRRRDRVR